MKKAEKKSVKAPVPKSSGNANAHSSLAKSSAGKNVPLKWMEPYKVYTFAYLPNAPDEHDDINYGIRSINMTSISATQRSRSSLEV